MKKKDSTGLGMTIPKRVRLAGMTFYLRNGQVVGRESSTHEKRSNTLAHWRSSFSGRRCGTRRNYESGIVPDVRHSDERRHTANGEARVG